VIITWSEEHDTVKKITFGMLKAGKLVYRIDYDHKGWHLDSESYGIKHRKLPILHANSWSHALDLINEFGPLLPKKV